MLFSKIKENLTNAVINRIPDYSNYSDYRIARHPKELEYKNPESDEEIEAVKECKRSEFTSSGFSLVCIAAFIAVYFLFFYKRSVANSSNVVHYAFIGFFAIFVLFALIKPMRMIFAKPQIALCEVVSTRVVSTTEDNGSRSNSYFLIAAQHSSKIVCDNIHISHKAYNKLTNGDSVYVIKFGRVYGAWKAPF